jgi:RNA polymerase sigma-70 factor (ECF subfamily)
MGDMMTALEAEIPRLRRYALFLARDRHRADDLVQDCLVRAIDKRDSFQPGTNLRAWLFVILRNGFITELRQARLRADVEADPEDDHPAVATAPNQIDHLRLRELRHAVDELSPEHREILLLVVIEGLSYERAAEILAVQVGTVRSRLSRARAMLRERLDLPPVRAEQATALPRSFGRRPTRPRTAARQSRAAPPVPADAHDRPA